jgi:hypothetical protein
MTKLMNPAQLDAAIKSIATRGKKLDSDIQEAALSAISHFAEHGDIVFVNKLYLALSAGARKSSLALWFVTFTKAAVNTDAATKALAPFNVDKAKEFDLDGAMSTPWYDMKKEPELDELFDIQKALASLIAKAKKSAKVNDPAMLKSLEALTTVKA